tara:strand:+ start:4932 stop:7031 length:2100 start_codon:yes stop_codon:yes gene_type:complete
MARNTVKTGDPLVQYVQKCIRRNREARKPVEWRWYENAAFAAGYTNVEYDPMRMRPVALPMRADDSTNPQIQDKLRKYHAKLIAPRMMPECVPARNDRDSRKRSEVANALILHFWEKMGSIYSDHAAKLNMMVFGNGILAMQWNPDDGEWVTDYEYDKGAPVFTEMDVPQLDEFGQPSLVDMPMSREKTMSTKTWQQGLPKLRSVHPFNFFPDPQWRHLTVDQCMNYAERQIIPLEQLPHLFPDIEMNDVRSMKDPEDSFLFREVDSTFGVRDQMSGMESQKLVEVFDFYHGPLHIPQHNIHYPKGFRMILIGDQVASFVKDLPYNSYPHSTFRDRQYSDRGWGMSITDVLRGAQKRLDLVERIQIRAAERTADPPLMKPQGSTDQNFQGRPGEVYEYVPYGEEKPSYLLGPQLPQDIYAMRGQALADLETLSLTSAPVGGQTPARGDSAAYLDRLLEENQAAMAPTVQEIEICHSHMASHLIHLSEDHLPIGYRFALMGLGKIPQVIEFDGRPFNLLEIRIVPGSAGMSYPSQKRSAIMQLAANGILTDDSPRSAVITEIMLGSPTAARLTALSEPGDKAVAELNVQRVIDGRDPYFKPWMDHQVHIRVLLENMRDPKFFLDLTLDQQSRLESLLQQHQAAVAPRPGMEQGAPQPGGGLELLQGGGQEGAAGAGPAMAPAVASGYTGPPGQDPGEQGA